jgi:hypothetical protein
LCILQPYGCGRTYPYGYGYIDERHKIYRFYEIQRLSKGFAKNHRRVNMAKKVFFAGMLAMVSAFGMAAVGYDGGSTLIHGRQKE